MWRFLLPANGSGVLERLQKGPITRDELKFLGVAIRALDLYLKRIEDFYPTWKQRGGGMTKARKDLEKRRVAEKKNPPREPRSLRGKMKARGW